MRPSPRSRGVLPDSDLDLIEAARSHDQDAVDALYRRHRQSALRLARELTDPATAEDIVAEAFLRVLMAIRSGKGPSVAFRPYLLTTVRNAYVSHVRRDRPLVWVEDHVEAGTEVTGTDPQEQAQESRLLAEAFTSLPERWQLVLWHSTVEGDDHGTIARMLGIKPNAVAALAFRAREGLRRAYLAAHLASTDVEECRHVQRMLPDHVRRRPRGSRGAEVEAHLQDCHRCTAAALELRSINSTLGAVLAPALLGAAGASYAGPGGGAGGGTSPATGATGGAGGAVATATVATVAAVALALAGTLLVRATTGGSEDPVSVGGSPSGRAADPGDPSSAPAATGGSSTGRTSPAAPPSASTSTTASAHPAWPAPSSTGPADGPPPSADPGAPHVGSDPVPDVTDAGSPAPSVPPGPTAQTPTAPATGGASTQPPVRTTADLGLSAPSHTDYGTHDHVQMQVSAALDPTTVTFEVERLSSYAVHQDLDFVGATCAASPAPSGDDERTVLTCTLPAGTGTFAVDLTVEGDLWASLSVSAPDNDDPDPANDTLTFG